MRARLILIIALTTVSFFLMACGNAPSPGNVANTATAPNSNNPLETTKKPTEAVTNNAPTLAPVFKAYCDAWVKNDEAALRKVYSADTVKQFEQDMKAEKAKDLMKFLADDKVSGKPCEARNEKINGDSAVAEIVSDIYPKGFPIIFVKEGGEWKMTTKSPDIDSVKQQATNANTAK